VNDIVVFSGHAHRDLAAEICGHLGVALSPSRLTRFANDCLEVQLQENCRERDVFIIQTLCAPVQENLVELLLMLDAARGASAARITAVVPFYAYARSDKKDAPRISIGARLVADLMVASGANRVLTMQMHSPQVHGFFAIPVDHLHALNELAAHFRQYDLSNAVALSPDFGNARDTAAFARQLGIAVAVAPKQRISDKEVRIGAIIGDVHDKDIIVLDDEIARGTTTLEILERLREEKVRSIRIACTHGLFGAGSAQRLSDQPDVLEIVCTNSVPIAPEKHAPKLKVLSIAAPLAEAMRRIHDGESVSALFHA
jgi:ribose-phosphate pyrophosphokinase